jgi:hypothetical protein
MSISYQDIEIKYYAKSLGRINHKTDIKFSGSDIIIIGSMNKINILIFSQFRIEPTQTSMICFFKLIELQQLEKMHATES